MLVAENIGELMGIAEVFSLGISYIHISFMGYLLKFSPPNDLNR